MIRSNKVTKSAKDERCTLRIPGVCVESIGEEITATTVFAHFPDESSGRGIKSDDISGGYACGHCHDLIDGRVPPPEYLLHTWDKDKEFFMRRSQTRTLRLLIEKGLVRYGE